MALMTWTNWNPREKAVLTFLQDGANVLLIHKKRGLGVGKISAPGGRVEPGETWEQAAVRETREETGLDVVSLTSSAELWFQFADGYSLKVRAFLACGWSGILTPCDEADPFWHPARELPWTRMWADDALWLPKILGGNWVTGRFFFEGEEMREANLQVFKRPPGPIDG